MLSVRTLDEATANVPALDKSNYIYEALVNECSLDELQELLEEFRCDAGGCCVDKLEMLLELLDPQGTEFPRDEASLKELNLLLGELAASNQSLLDLREVHVSGLTGELCTVQIEPTQTVSELRKIAAEASNVSCAHLHLIHDGRLLYDYDVVGDLQYVTAFESSYVRALLSAVDLEAADLDRRKHLITEAFTHALGEHHPCTARKIIDAILGLPSNNLLGVLGLLGVVS